MDELVVGKSLSPPPVFPVDGHMIWHKEPGAATPSPAESSSGEEKGRQIYRHTPSCMHAHFLPDHLHP